MRIVLTLIGITLLLITSVCAQDSVDVTFRYKPTVAATRVYVPGEFNSWANNSSGTISSGNTSALMFFDNVSGSWYRTIRLLVGRAGNGIAIAGAYQYKFNINGTNWISDPLNTRVNTNDQSNSYLYVKDPTIYQFVPNQVSGLVKTGTPEITAYIFPKVGASVDTSTISVTVDGIRYNKIGAHYDTSSKQLTFPVSSLLQNGKHTVLLFAGSSAGGTNSDSVTFTIQAGLIQITTQGGNVTYNPVRTIRGAVMDTSVHTVKLIHNSKDTATVSVSNGLYSIVDTLVEGQNSFKAITGVNGVIVSSDSVTFILHVNHTPYAKASVSSFTSSQVTLSAAGSTDPDGKMLTFTWIDDSKTPLLLNGRQGSTITIAKPAQPGEYYFYLIAANSSGFADTTRSYFIIDNNDSCSSPAITSNPEWAKRARIYFLFPKAFTSTGTIPAAAQRLQYIHDMGFNVIWMMPVMKNAYPIDQHYGPGYNIVDFYTVAPEYGTNDDFKNFIAQAHALGMKVILDVTPNHTSRSHPWSIDAHTYHEDSWYWTWYEHSNQPSSQTNNLGSSLDADGFNYYSGFSDQLLNFNWSDIDARTEMINAYKYWIKYLDLDGYRFDVYWGPHRRYGEAYMGDPVREALKHIKPDILLLGEDDGTGVNKQYIYADAGGGLDAAYDFKLYFNQIENFGFTSSAIDNLHNEINNGGYYPGPNSLYMRFMESQDEDCITYFYSDGNLLDAATTFNRTKPMATTIFSVPGFPMIWNGQEVGWGYGIPGAKEDRNRSTIGWNFQGGPILLPHYQRLAWIRGTFPAFATQVFERIGTGNANVYGILRKYQNENAISLCNFGSESAQVSFMLIATGAPNVLFSNPQNGKLYYVNDVYNDTTYQITFSGGVTNFSMNLPAYGSAVLIVSDSIKKLSVPKVTSVETNGAVALPAVFKLYQNFPNPFNPSTTIQFCIPKAETITIRIFNILGQEVAVVAHGIYTAGEHQVQWNGYSLEGRPMSSGVYFIRLEAGTMTDTRKIILMK
jgi:glycosidase